MDGLLVAEFINELIEAACFDAERTDNANTLIGDACLDVKNMDAASGGFNFEMITESTNQPCIYKKNYMNETGEIGSNPEANTVQNHKADEIDAKTMIEINNLASNSEKETQTDHASLNKEIQCDYDGRLKSGQIPTPNIEKVVKDCCEFVSNSEEEPKSSGHFIGGEKDIENHAVDRLTSGEIDSTSIEVTRDGCKFATSLDAEIQSSDLFEVDKALHSDFVDRLTASEICAPTIEKLTRSNYEFESNSEEVPKSCDHLKGKEYIQTAVDDRQPSAEICAIEESRGDRDFASNSVHKPKSSVFEVVDLTNSVVCALNIEKEVKDCFEIVSNSEEKPKSSGHFIGDKDIQIDGEGRMTSGDIGATTIEKVALDDCEFASDSEEDTLSNDLFVLDKDVQSDVDDSSKTGECVPTIANVTRDDCEFALNSEKMAESSDNFEGDKEIQSAVDDRLTKEEICSSIIETVARGGCEFDVEDSLTAGEIFAQAIEKVTRGNCLFASNSVEELVSSEDLEGDPQSTFLFEMDKNIQSDVEYHVTTGEICAQTIEKMTRRNKEFASNIEEEPEISDHVAVCESVYNFEKETQSTHVSEVDKDIQSDIDDYLTSCTIYSPTIKKVAKGDYEFPCEENSYAYSDKSSKIDAPSIKVTYSDFKFDDVINDYDVADENDGEQKKSKNRYPSSSDEVTKDEVEIFELHSEGKYQSHDHSEVIDTISEIKCSERDSPVTNNENCIVSLMNAEINLSVYDTPAKLNACVVNAKEFTDNLKISSIDSTAALAVTSTKEFASITVPEFGDEFYTHDMLLRIGYSFRVYESARELTNFALTNKVSQISDNDIQCTGFSSEMMENQLIPLFEKFGEIFRMCLKIPAEGRNKGKVYVTYATQGAAERATKIMNGREVQGRCITVAKYLPSVRIFVKPIPTSASKTEIFQKFKYLTNGLVKVLLFNTPLNDGKNRGFCFLEYINGTMAHNAKKNLYKKKVFGTTPLFTDWPDRRSVDAPNKVPNTLYISNLRPGIRSWELREFFTVYGEITAIDRDAAFACIQFRNSEDMMRAGREIDKKLLGNDNVELSFTKLLPHRNPMHRQVQLIKKKVSTTSRPHPLKR